MKDSLHYIKNKWGNEGFQRYFKSTSWSLSSKILSMIISFAATTFIARNLGPTNYGQLSYAVSFVGLFSFIASLGIDNVLYRELIKTPEKRNELLGSGLLIKVLAGTVASIICILSSLLFGSKDVSLILIVILTGTFVLNAFQIINHEFQARVQGKYPSIITLVVPIILNLLKILVIVLGKGVIYLALILLLESLLYAVLYMIAYEMKLKEHLKFWKYDHPTAMLLIKDSWPLIFSTAFVLIYSRIDQVFIKHMIDATSVGIYDAAVRIAEVWYFIPSIIVTALFPAILSAKASSEELYLKRLGKLALFLLAIALSISVLVGVLAPYLMKVLYGAEFMGGVIILQIYVWATVGIFLGTLALSYLLAENFKKILFFSSFLPMVSNVLLNLLWIPTYGIAGAAYATLISYMLVPLSLLMFKKTRAQVFTMCKLMI